MNLRHQNLCIRNALPKDAALLCAWWNDGRVMAHAGFPNGLNTNEQKIAQSLSEDSDGSGRRLILEADGLPVGEMNYRSKGGGTAEIGIKICETGSQGKGYGTLFLKMLITALFLDGFEKIILDTNLTNTRAQHVYEKLGFKKLGTNLDAWQDQLGKWQSSVDYELLSAWFEPLDMEMLP